MTYTGKIAQDSVDAEGNRIGVSWQDIDPITLLS
jgi:sigma54-dependent transcription regulator